MGGNFTETSEVTALTTPHRNLVGIICGGDFYGKVKLEGGIINDFGRNTRPVFHESSEVYFTSGSASGGIYYGTEIYGDAKIGGGAYCTVEFKTVGGSEVPEQKVLRGKKIAPLSVKTTKTGYVFGGWLKNGAPFDLETTLFIDYYVELTAVWSECDHSGSTAKPTCTGPAACTVCGESYGELDANNHADLRHIEAKAATKDAEGNIEYWHCEGCGKYYADAAASKEITEAETVTAKLPDDPHPTGDNSGLALWSAMLFICGGVAIGMTAIGKKKKRSAK